MKSRLIALLFLVPITVCLSAQSPCNTNPEYRQFDFWVGQWDVYKYGTDTMAGTNNVVKLLDDCVIQENWTSARGRVEGKSYNSYDPISDKWRQTWVDNTGSTLQFSGFYKDNQMMMSAHSKDNKGKLIYYRMIFTKMDDGTVRQQWDKSYNRKDWTPMFDGHYVPKGTGPRLDVPMEK